MIDKMQQRTIYLERKVWADESKEGQLTTGLFSFSQAERAEIDGKVQKLVKANELDVLLGLTPANFTYLTGLMQPFAEQTPERRAIALRASDDGELLVICPLDWQDAFVDQGWTGSVITYDDQNGLPPDGMLKAVCSVLQERGFAKACVGADLSWLPQLVVDALKTALPDVTWKNVDTALQDLRMVKTAAEVRHLEEAARQDDRALMSALNHSEGNLHDPLNYDLWEFAERVRVHVGEFGGSGVGHVSALQGTDMQVYYRPTDGVFVPGNLVRMDVTSHHRGYWSNNTRTFVVGHPNAAQERAYQENISLKQAALQALQPGKAAKDVFAAVEAAAEAGAIEFWREPGVGHGVGTSEREAPFLLPESDTVLQAGMALVVGVTTYGPQRELICSKDMVVITEDGYRCLSWYKDWDSSIYNAFGQTARHG